MLTEDGKDSRLFGEISALVAALGLRTVEVTDTVHQGAHSMRVVVSKDDGDVTTDDLAAVYGIIYPRYSVILSDRDLQLEVSSPGLQRTLKDVLEFEVFRGRLVRVYSISRSAYAVGRIAGCSSDGVTLSECMVEGHEGEGETITLPYSDIAKAKLEYRWEASNA